MTLLTLQQLSISMEDGKVLRWLVADGDAVEKGEVLVEIETDKATIEVESPADGILRILAEEGAIVPVEGTLAELQAGGAAAASVDLPGDVEAPAAPEAGPPPAFRPAREVAGDSPAVSPAARRLAAERGIDLAGIRGSGPGGRIVARDLEGAGESAPVESPVESLGPGLREAVIRNITASWKQIPHVHIAGELAADGLVAARAAVSAGAGKVTVTDLLAFALARALVEVPELNGTLRPDGTVARSEPVGLSLAVATPGGVVAPVIGNAASLSLGDLAAERARLVAAARDGSLDRRALARGTVTLSNLGAYPVDFFAPVVSGPQIAMIATGRVVERPVAEGGMIGVRWRLWANVAIDHRAADGEAGGRLLAAFERQIAALPGAVG